MNWLRYAFIVVLIAAAIVAIALTGFPVVLGTLLLIGIVSLLMTISDAGFNRTVQSAKRFSCRKDFTLQMLYEELSRIDFSPWSSMRIAGIKMIRGFAIVLESPDDPDYFYIYKSRSGRKIYVATSTMKSYIRDAQPDWAKDLAVTLSAAAANGEGGATLAEISDRLYCACRNIAENGTAGFEPTEKMLREMDDEPPALFRIPRDWSRSVREHFADKNQTGLLIFLRGLEIGLLGIVAVLITFPNETVQDIYSVIIVFVVFPLAAVLIVWGIVRQIIDWIKSFR